MTHSALCQEYMRLLGKLLSTSYCVTSTKSFGSSFAIVASAFLVLFGSQHRFDALLKALHLLASFNLYRFDSPLASSSSPCKIACVSRSCFSNSEVFSSAIFSPAETIVFLNINVNVILSILMFLG